MAGQKKRGIVDIAVVAKAGRMDELVLQCVPYNLPGSQQHVPKDRWERSVAYEDLGEQQYADRP